MGLKKHINHSLLLGADNCRFNVFCKVKINLNVHIPVYVSMCVFCSNVTERAITLHVLHVEGKLWMCAMCWQMFRWGFTICCMYRNDEW